MNDIIIWQYGPRTSTEVLYRHHRIVRWIAGSCFFLCVAGISATAEMLISGPSSVTMFVCGVGTVLGGILMIPTLCIIPWMKDIEVELKKRGLQVPGGVSLDHRISSAALKMMFWFAVAVAGPIILGRLLK